ncbi:MAG: cell division protein FtsA [Opitutales bacterium]|nr:cell division protein FtsA [Opitutales bacterium]
MAESKIIGALEMGTTKVAVLIAEVIDTYRLNIIGSAVVPSEGIKKGRIYDAKKANRCVHMAITDAEKSAGVNLKTVYMTVTGSDIQGERQVGKAQISHMAKVVTEYDVNRAQEEAKRRQLPDGRVYVQFMRNPFEVDGVRVDEPYSVKGNELQANYWAVHADEVLLKRQIEIVNSFMVKVDEVFLAGLASGRVVATDDEKEKGIVVLDIGGGSTDYAVYSDGYVLRTGVIDVGGDHITNDLSLAFRIPWENAEQIKIEQAKAVIREDETDEMVWMRGDLSIGDRKISRRTIQKVVHARLEELFQVVKHDIDPILSEYKLSGSVVLTGGTSRLTAIEALAHQTLKMPVRMGRNPDWVIPELQGPEMSSVIGLLQFAFSDVSGDLPEQPRQRSLFSRFSGLLHR